jgi:hypothetical protein
MAPSEMRTASALSLSRFARTKGRRLGLPISSSPSTRNLMLTGASRPSKAATWAKSWPLSSEAPRA